MNGRQSQGLGMMITAMGLLVLPGFIINNLQDNGLINTSQAQVCNPLTDTCTLSANVGCQYNIANCQLQGSTLQFLNPCSTWTNILTLNYIGFINSFFTNCGQYVQQQTTTLNSNQSAIGTGVIGPQQGGNATFTGCNTTTADPFGLGLINFKCPTSAPSPLYVNGVQLTSPYHFSCGQFLIVIGNGTSSPPKPSLASCTMSDSGTSTTFISSVSCWLYQPTTGPLPNIRESICKAGTLFTYGVSLGTGVVSSSSISFGSILSFALSLLGGVILIFIGLGLNVSSGVATINASIGSNPQGSKLAQTFGMGLLVFFPLYSEFNTWFSNGYLPYGLDGDIFAGQLGIVSVAIVVLMFFGLYSVSQSGTPSSS